MKYFNNEVGSCPHKVVLITIPKSGTWMYVNVLRHFNLVFTGVDIRGTSYVDHRGNDPQTQRKLWQEQNFKIVQQPIATSVKMIQPGQFVTSHMMPSLHPHVANCKKIFTFRNARTTLISAMRWNPKFDETKPTEMMRYITAEGAKHLSRIKSRLPWLNKDVYKIQFEQFVSGTEEERIIILDNLAKFLDTTYDPQALEQIGSKTMTFTGKHSTLDKFWSDEIENWFIRNGGVSINKQLGYDE